MNASPRKTRRYSANNNQTTGFVEPRFVQTLEMASSGSVIPGNLATLHHCEEQLRQKALGVLEGDQRLQLHLSVVEAAMDLADVFRQFDTSDEDLKVIKILGMRAFNATYRRR
jgi:hypothetical protein